MNNPDHRQHITTSQEDYVPWNLLDVFFCYVLIFGLSIIFAGTLLLAGADVNMNLFVIVMQLLLSFSTLGIVYLIITKKYKTSFNEALGLSLKNIRTSLSLGIIITASIIITTSFISLIFSEFAAAPEQNPYMEMSQERLKLITILAIFIAPIVEEIFFRGFMQPAISKLTGPFLGIVITALIFAVSHTQYLEYSTALYSVTAIGIILGVTRYKTGSVMPGIFAHFFNNLLAVAVIF